MSESPGVTEVVKAVQRLGFRSAGTRLHRKAKGGRVVQLVFVQSGRGHLEGRFTVAMGSFLPAVYQLVRSTAPPRLPDISKCQITTRVPVFAGAGDVWFEATSSSEVLADVIRTEVPRFFSLWGEVPAILESWRKGTPLHDRNVRVSRFAIASLLHDEGADEEARKLLLSMYDDCEGTQKDTRIIERFAGKLGLNLSR